MQKSFGMLWPSRAAGPSKCIFPGASCPFHESSGAPLAYWTSLKRCSGVPSTESDVTTATTSAIEVNKSDVTQSSNWNIRKYLPQLWARTWNEVNINFHEKVPQLWAWRRCVVYILSYNKVRALSRIWNEGNIIFHKKAPQLWARIWNEVNIIFYKKVPQLWARIWNERATLFFIRKYRSFEPGYETRSTLFL